MQLELWQIVLLAIVQGVTEFLPISSDGHLAVAAALMLGSGETESLEIPDLVIVLHGGTLVSILVFYWRRIRELLQGERRTIGMLIVASVPAVAVGLPVKLFAEKWLASPLLAGVFLIVTGLVLVIARWLSPRSGHYRELKARDALLVGLAQAAAILPGLSRSGCTITAGLKLGLSPQSSATFSFLMAIPVIAGACAVELVTLWEEGGIATPVEHLLLGVLVSFMVGLVSLWWLVRWLERGRFAYFAWWCIPVGLCVVIWQVLELGT